MNMAGTIKSLDAVVAVVHERGIASGAFVFD